MRDLKFRVWNKKRREWLLGYEFESLGGFSMLGEVQMMGAYAALLTSYFPDRIDEIVLMQFTNLKDVEGKEIYEGDVLEWEDAFKQHQKDYVLWNEEYGWWSLSKDSGSALGTRKIKGRSPIKIIGNIYENPELLK